MAEVFLRKPKLVRNARGLLRYEYGSCCLVDPRHQNSFQSGSSWMALASAACILPTGPPWPLAAARRGAATGGRFAATGGRFAAAGAGVAGLAGVAVGSTFAGARGEAVAAAAVWPMRKNAT